MAKRVLILITVCMLLLAVWAPDTAASGGVVLRGAANVSLLSPDELSAYTNEAIVFVTRTARISRSRLFDLSKSSSITWSRRSWRAKSPAAAATDAALTGLYHAGIPETKQKRPAAVRRAL